MCKTVKDKEFSKSIRDLWGPTWVAVTTLLGAYISSLKP